VEIGPAPEGFDDWAALRALVTAAFAFMEGRIDPPSSLTRMDAAALAAQAREGTLFLAWDAGRLVGCLFAAEAEDALYLTKLAVAPARRGEGIGRALVEAAAEAARARGLAALTLSTRVELTENHAAFARMGFRETGRTAHPGFDRPTSVAMRRGLAGADREFRR
jgi:ribosomal protein S18 acetylase RimI-like enzyme